MERMLPSDFEPKKHHARVSDSSVPDTWPFSYQDLVPYYRQAEQIYAVCGTPDPLNPDPEGKLASPPPMSERDAHIFDSLKGLGLTPTGPRGRYLPSCSGCAVRLSRDCKTDAGRVCMLPAIEQHGAAVLAEAEVQRLVASGDRVTAVKIKHRGVEAEITGRVIVVAAGALMTPVLLLRSTSEEWPTGLANKRDLVGRNLMMHTSDFIAVRPSKMFDPTGPAKAISVNDLYVRGGRKLGALQSVGMPVTPGSIDAFLRGKAQKDPSLLLNVGGAFGRKVASRIGAALFQQANIFASVVEDLPYHHNRVVRDDQVPNGMRFEYTYPAAQERELSRAERWLLPSCARWCQRGQQPQLRARLGHRALGDGSDQERGRR
jgi:choline dehydrogenase-like flavoprotein